MLPGANGERRGFLRKEQLGAGWHNLRNELRVLAISAYAHGRFGFWREGCEGNNRHLGGLRSATEHQACEIKIGSAYVGSVIDRDGVWAAAWIGTP